MGRSSIYCDRCLAIDWQEVRKVSSASLHTLLLYEAVQRLCSNVARLPSELQDWREKVGVGSILEQPQPFFEFAKGMYTHGLVCFTKNGAPVWLDKVGEMKREWSAFKV